MSDPFTYYKKSSAEQDEKVTYTQRGFANAMGIDFKTHRSETTPARKWRGSRPLGLSYRPHPKRFEPSGLSRGKSRAETRRDEVTRSCQLERDPASPSKSIVYFYSFSLQTRQEREPCGVFRENAEGIGAIDAVANISFGSFFFFLRTVSTRDRS